MTKAKPGEWLVEEDYVDDHHVFLIKGDKNLIARTAKGVNIEEARKSAYLIASAPALLDMVILLKDRLSEFWPLEFSQQEAELFMKVDNLIDKAKGESKS